MQFWYNFARVFIQFEQEKRHRTACLGPLGALARQSRRKSCPGPDVNGPFALSVCIGSLEMPLNRLASLNFLNVGIRPRINHMKLNEHTRRLLLSPSVRIARSELFLYFSFLNSRCYNSITQTCIYTRTTPTQAFLDKNKPDRLVLVSYSTRTKTQTSTQTTTRPTQVRYFPN
jgi:hypothetical protein